MRIIGNAGNREVQALFSLLDLLSNPAAAKARLTELVAAAERAEFALAQAKSQADLNVHAQQELDAKREALSAQESALVADKSSFEEVHAIVESRVAALHKAQAEFEAHKAEAESALKARASELEAMVAAFGAQSVEAQAKLDAFADELAARHEALSAREDALVEREASHEVRVSKLKELVG